MLKSLRDHFLRIDARSLGLFRVAFALALIGDLFARWRWARDFYSNEGALPNHNHLFNLRGKQDIFSVYHAFSTVGEAHFAFALTLFVYVCFLIGWRARVFHVLALVALVSLTSRNILLENAGNYAAIAILAFTAFLPTGSRFSLDSLRRSMELREEQRAADLNDRTPAPEAAVVAARLPGWSPVSVAALAALAQLAVIYACSALQQHGEAWRDGSALHYALHVDRWVSGIGAWARGALPAGAIRGLTHAVRGAEMAIPALLFVPFLFRWTRGLAAVLMLVHGLLLGLLFDFGLFGWSLAAAAPLVVSRDTWDAYERGFRPKRARTVIYDADCGVCLWIARLLKRADLRGHLTFQGNDDLDELLVGAPGGGVERRKMPAEVTAALADRTVIVLDRDGRVFTRGRAVVEALRALPLGWLAAPLALPGLSHALGALYDGVAVRRQRISALMGKEACGIPALPDDEVEGGAAADVPLEASPARRAARLVSGSLREIAAIVVAIAMLAQTAKENPVPQSLAIPQGKVLAAVAAWPRMLARWDLMAPEPPRENGMMVIDAQTRGGQAADPLTGRAPEFDFAARGRAGMGQLWADYLDRVRRKEWSEFERSFRDYLVKGGPRWDREPKDNQITGYDAYWLTQPIGPPGEAAPAEATKEKLFSHARGGTGRTGIERVPMRRPAPILPKPQE